MRLAYQHLRADNDASGNARRVWVLYDVSETWARTVEVVDEGNGNLPRQYRTDACELPTQDITVTKYRNIIRSAERAHHLVRAS